MKYITPYVLDTIRQIGNSFQDGYVLIDRDYKIVWVNEFLEKKGFKLENIKDTFYFKTFNNKDKADENCSTALAFNSGKVENKIEKGKDNKYHYVTSIPLSFDNEVKYVLEISKEKAVKEAATEKKDIKLNLKPGYDKNKLVKNHPS